MTINNTLSTLAFTYLSFTAFMANAQIAAPCVDPIPVELTEIKARTNVQISIQTKASLIDCNMVPVGANRDGYHLWRDPNNLYQGKPSYHFYMKDDKTNRVELSSAFVTQENIDKLSKDKIDENIAAKSLYHYGQGFVTKGEAWTYEYGLWLPSSLDKKSKGIISQWHGVVDRTTVSDPSGNLTNYSLSDFNSYVLTKMRFKGSIGYDLKTNKENGYKVDQGGYPPLSLKVGEGNLYLLARVDHNRITDKTDRINLRPPQKKSKAKAVMQMKRSKGGSKEISIPFWKPLTELPKDQWIDMKWEIVWSDWADNGRGILNDGSIRLWLDGKQVLDWVGPIGNNDEHGTYFKYGIYKPGASGIEVRLAGFNQFKSLVTAQASLLK